jgi:hypothetical protein
MMGRGLPVILTRLMLPCALLLGGCGALLGLDDPTPGAAIDAATVDGAAPADAGPDAAACTDETDLATNPDHCGRCDHGCGGGTCAQGECQPIELAAGIPGLAAIAVAADAIVWTETARVAACPLPAGCTLAPRPIADPYDRLGPLAVAGERVFFAGCRTGADSCDDQHRFYECPLAGCPTSPVAIDSDTTQFEQVLVGPTHAYWRSATIVSGCALADCAGTDASWGRLGQVEEITHLALDAALVYAIAPAALVTCPEDAGCATPTPTTGTASIAGDFGAHAGRAYWWAQTGGGPRIQTCMVAACTVESFANDVAGTTQVRADDTGVYWLNPTAMTIRQCPLAGCPPGGAITVARGIAGAANLTLGPGFVYFSRGGAIYKVAKP